MKKKEQAQRIENLEFQLYATNQKVDILLMEIEKLKETMSKVSKLAVNSAIDSIKRKHS